MKIKSEELIKAMENDLLDLIRSREPKYTTFTTMCSKFAFRKCLVEARDSLVKSGRIRKTRSGFITVKNMDKK